MRCYRCGQKDHFKRDCLVENININMLEVEESKPIISKMILKKSKVGDKAKVETETSEVKVNFWRGFSIYRYNISDRFQLISSLGI